MTQLYFTDSYIKEIETKITEVRIIKKKEAIVLENNIFYPSGGGQPYDIGFIEINNEKINITRILKLDGKIFVCLEENAGMQEGNSVKAVLNWEKRYKYMKCHTAAHLLMGQIKKNISNYVPDGIEILEDGETVIVTFMGNWNNDIETANKIINDSNAEIQKGADVYSEIYSTNTSIEKIYKDTFRGETELREGSRLIVIENLDVNPCGGTHVKNLKEITKITLIEFKENEFKVKVT